MKYYEVLPLTKTGAEDRVFTYETDLDVAVGSLVSVPLRNRFVRGLVTKKVVKPKFATKPIKKVQSVEPVLSAVQLTIAEQIAEYYFCSLGDVISCILSFDFGKKRREVKNIESRLKNLEKPLKLTKDQEASFRGIKKAKPGSKHLLFGVTGSGKTEIYLQLAADALAKGCGSIILVPEISLTPQTLDRFTSRFGEKVAVWHSGLKETEKYATWQKINSGEKMIVLGARSAIFTPVKNLGYIFIDEEHESSYKQDQTPRYETGRVAEWISDICGAKLVAGTATPQIETFWKTEQKKYSLWRLNTRIVQDSMPPVKIIDLRVEFQKRNKSIFSELLSTAITAALADKKQVLLFVNRRGASTFVVCRDCGHVEQCPHCETPLTFHLQRPGLGVTLRPGLDASLRCHHCGYAHAIPTICPECKSYAIRYFGLGTQRVELEARKMFPKAKICRMDSDTTAKRGSHEEIYRSFAEGSCDILIGTQLIAKGWDLPNVALVGVVSADTMLNLPDYRSTERTFDMLTQISGRVGRGYHPGKVIVQTYNPENYAIRAAADHDFDTFYAREIKERKKYHYPPFAALVKLTFSGPVEDTVKKETERLAVILVGGTDKIEVLGPSPSFYAKLAGKYRYQIVIKLAGRDQGGETRKGNTLNRIKPELKQGWIVDINPDNLL